MVASIYRVLYHENYLWTWWSIQIMLKYSTGTSSSHHYRIYKKKMGKKSLEKVVASLEKTKTDEDQKAISEKKRGFTMQQTRTKVKQVSTGIRGGTKDGQTSVSLLLSWWWCNRWRKCIRQNKSKTINLRMIRALFFILINY